MGSQGFRNIAGNPFVYQEDTRSAAFGLDAAAQKWKLSVKATTGALPTDTAQLMIDPATNGDVTIDPNGSGNLVVTSGNISITAGNLVLPSVGAYLYWSVDATQRGQVFINKMVTAASFPAHRFLHSTGISTGGYDTCAYLGHGAGESVGNTTQGNAFVGYNAAPVLANSGAFTGGYNCGIGSGAMLSASSAQFNFCAGNGVANSMTSGIQNTILSAYGAYRLTTGNYNCILGTSSQLIASDVRYWGAGYNLTGSESNNVLIQALGATGVSNRLQIGDATGTGVGQLDSAFICGIYGKTVGATNGLVYIDNANQLGSTNSPSVTGSITAGTNLISTAGNLQLPLTTATTGQITMNGVRYLHSYGGDANVFLGKEAGRLTTTSGNYNIGIGYLALNNIGAGVSNCCFGQGAGQYINGGSYNMTIGQGSGYSVTSGNYNTSYGAYSMYSLTTGNNNICIGSNSTSVSPYGSGGNYTGAESSNICIHNYGVTGESNKIHIGTTGTGVGQQNACYIAGIYGVTPGGTQNIALIDSNGQLGSTATLSPSFGGAMTWTEVTGTSQAAAVNNGYITNNVALVTVTLPSTAAVGQRVRIGGKGAGLWKLAQNSGQVIHFGSIDTTTGTGGYLAATVKYDTVEVICITANTDWLVLSSVGSLTIV